MYATLASTYGTQRYIYIQSYEDINRRRKRRISKKKRKSTLPLKTRVFHILSTSKIKDYTHPSETDIFWNTLYRQYEFLRYMELYYKASVAKIGRPLDDKEICDIVRVLNIVDQYKNLLIRYMMNAMPCMYGSVMNKKFYGWYEHVDEFVSKFNETALQIIHSLRFDVNRTRCSVYFYQAFWLTGISFKTEVADNIYRYELFEMTGDDRNTLFSINKSNERKEQKMIEDMEEILEVDAYENSLIEEIETELIDNSNYDGEDLESNKGLVGKESGEEDEFCVKYGLVEGENDEEYKAEYDSTEAVCTVAEYLLNQIGLSRSNLNTCINDLGMYIKRLINKGEIKLTEQHKELLRNVGYCV